MKKTLLIVFALALINLMALLFHGLGASTVVDESGKPLAGVHVVAEYWGETIYFYGSHRTCFRLEVMMTAADGRFDVPFISGNFNPIYFDRSRYIRYFKAGYEVVPNQIESADPVKMQPFSGDAKQRFGRGSGLLAYGDYSVYNPQLACPDVQKKFYPLLLAIHAEAKQIAKTYEDRLRVLDYEYQIEIGNGTEEKVASKNYTEGKLRLRKEMGLQGNGY